jgi:hypothetical protein
MTKKAKTSPLLSLHEPISADTRTISLSLVSLAITIVASLIIVALLLWFLSSDNRHVAAENLSAAAQGRSVAFEVPAGVPALDPHQADELDELRAHDRKILSDYAWIDRQSGIARIPIVRAMQILAQRADSSENRSKDEGRHE